MLMGLSTKFEHRLQILNVNNIRIYPKQGTPTLVFQSSNDGKSGHSNFYRFIASFNVKIKKKIPDSDPSEDYDRILKIDPFNPRNPEITFGNQGNDDSRWKIKRQPDETGKKTRKANMHAPLFSCVVSRLFFSSSWFPCFLFYEFPPKVFFSTC